MLENEFKYYQDNKKDFDDKYHNQYVAIKNDEILGIYNTEHDALVETLKEHDAGTFLIQKCSKDDEQIMKFYSRISLANL